LNSKLDNLVQDFKKKEDFEKRKNPKEMSFNQKHKRIQTNKRKIEYEQIELEDEDVIPET